MDVPSKLIDYDRHTELLGKRIQRTITPRYGFISFFLSRFDASSRGPVKTLFDA